MRNSLIYFLVLASAFILPACEQNPCENVNCNERGECVDGDCLCFDGYTGEGCKNRETLKYIGTYSANRACDNDNDNVIVEITQSNDEVRKIFIHLDSNKSIFAYVYQDSIDIENQYVLNIWEVSASSGQFTAQAINFDLHYEFLGDPANQVHCTYSLPR